MEATTRILFKTSVEEWSVFATQRQSDLFAADVEAYSYAIREQVAGKRILVIGGAGSIGSSTIRELIRFNPRTLHVVDVNENGLAELVRDFRSSRKPFDIPDFRTIPIDFGSSIMLRFLMEQEPYDHVLNFAALKHVRSEKDIYSLLQMLDVNLIKPARLLKWLNERGGTTRYFCVSTDKAANPVNLMGASKRLMEHIIFSGSVASGLKAQITSARFPNVAFSDGSLLFSWLKRIEKHQPLAVPKETRRFFISLREAGQICILAAFCTPNRHILIPRLDPVTELRQLQPIAEAFIVHHGFKPRLYESEMLCRLSVSSDMRTGHYPLLITALDTDGEKTYEEFAGPYESPVELGMSNLLAVEYCPLRSGNLFEFIEMLEEFQHASNIRLTKGWLIQEISIFIPEFVHRHTGKILDNQM